MKTVMHHFWGKRKTDQWIKSFRKTKKPYFEGTPKQDFF